MTGMYSLFSNAKQNLSEFSDKYYIGDETCKK